MEKNTRNYVSLCLNITLVALLVIIIFGISAPAYFDALQPIPWHILALSFLSIFGSVIYYQFKDKKILWGIINIVLLITYIDYYGTDDDNLSYAFALLLISSMIYYFKYIKPRFAKKHAIHKP